jgi:hypothetical protein
MGQEWGKELSLGGEILDGEAVLPLSSSICFEVRLRRIPYRPLVYDQDGCVAYERAWFQQGIHPRALSQQYSGCRVCVILLVLGLQCLEHILHTRNELLRKCGIYYCFWSHCYFAFRCRHLAQTHPILYQNPQTPALPFACPIPVYWISSVCVSLSSFHAS